MLAIFEQVCQTVAYAHARGVIHRDLKPSNIMVGLRRGAGDGLGTGQGPAPGRAPTSVAEPAEEAARQRHPPRSAAARMPDLRRPARVMGTPAYMAPEQARGDIEESTSGPTSSAWARSSARSSPAGRRTPARPAEASFARRSAARWPMIGAAGKLRRGSRVGLPGAAEPGDLSRRTGRRDAGKVARRLTAYLDRVQERLRAAELAGPPRRHEPRKPRQRPRRPSGPARPRRRGPRKLGRRPRQRRDEPVRSGGAG